jgi:hypothetical protein
MGRARINDAFKISRKVSWRVISVKISVRPKIKKINVFVRSTTTANCL